jgi:hypothetical protein
MEVTSKSFLKPENIDFEYFSENFSEEIVINIFSFLPIDELINCSLVQKKWERISADESLWMYFVKGLKIELYDEINCRISTSEKINMLRMDLKIGVNALNDNVKTGRELDGYYEKISIAKSNNEIKKIFGHDAKTEDELNEYEEKVLYKYKQELEKKLLFSSKIRKGFSSSLLLYKVEFCALVQVEAFASALSNKCNSSDGWMHLCMTLIEKKNYAAADRYLVDYIEKQNNQSMNYARVTFCYNKIFDHGMSGELEEAIAVFVKYFPKQHKICYSECKSLLLTFIREANRLDLIEKIIDMYSNDVSHLYMISQYLQELIKGKDVKAIISGLTKYSNFFKNDTDEIELTSLIEAYVEVGQINAVWDFIKKYKKSEDLLMLLYGFRNILNDHNNFKEAEKVELMIKMSKNNGFA